MHQIKVQKLSTTSQDNTSGVDMDIFRDMKIC